MRPKNKQVRKTLIILPCLQLIIEEQAGIRLEP